MKRKLILIALSVIALTAKAQYMMKIQGLDFNIETNEQDMSAMICYYDAVITDAHKSKQVDVKSRKIKKFDKKAPETLIIPSEFVDPFGRKYTITAIGKAAFSGLENFSFVVVPSTIKTIEDYAFFKSSVKSVLVPNSVKYIGSRAFGWCEDLMSLRIPENVALGEEVFTQEQSPNLNVKYMPVGETEQAFEAIENEADGRIVVSDVDTELPAASSQNNDMFAVIIANEEYQKVSHVKYALNDGRTFQRYCRQLLGIPSENIRIVENATSGQMLEQINWLRRIADVYGNDARIIVYYAGHGIPNEKDGTAYLLPVDASGDNVSAAYSLKDLYGTLGSMKVKDVTVFMDACFSGILASARGIARMAKDETPQGNMVVFSAAQGDETAYPYDEKGHGLFTYFLLKKMKDTQGNVNFGTLDEYIRKEVSRKAIVVNDKPQTPKVSASTVIGDWKSMRLK